MSRTRFLGGWLVLITLAVYLPITQNGFLNFDDKDYVTENPVVQRGITWPGIRWAFTSWHASNWHPLTWLSHMADCELFGLNPAGHHLVNLLFHVANVWLLFQLWWRLTDAPWASAMVAALFGWHPLHVESVAWVAERKDVLSTFFGLLALLNYVRYARQPLSRCYRSGAYWWAWLFFCLGLMAKPMLVTLPFVMVLLDFWPLRRNWRARALWLEKWPFVLLAAAASVVTVLAQHAEAIAPLAKYSFELRAENVLAAYAGYLYRVFWPLQLAVFYPLIEPGRLALGLAVVVLVVISLLVWQARSRPYLLAGWLWYLGTLVPVIGWVQVGDQAMADRYTYFPLIGIFFAVTWLVKDWAPGRLPPAGLAGMAALILAACVGLTEWQLQYWHDSQALFAHALAVAPDNATARLNLGEALQEARRPAEALREYRQALKLDPRRHEVYHNIGRLLNDEGKPAEALAYCRMAVALEERSPESHTGLGVVLGELGQYDEAIREFSQAARLDPRSAAPHLQTGRLCLKMGRDAEAVVQFREAARLEPGNAGMLLYMARVLAADQNPSGRDGAEALALAQQAVRLAGGQSVVALDTLAMAWAETGHFETAARLARQALDAARAGGNQEDVTNIQQRLELYQKQQPARMSFDQP